MVAISNARPKPKPRDQQPDRSRDFQNAGHEPKPLAESDLRKFLDHGRRTDQLDTASEREHHSEENCQNPASDVFHCTLCSKTTLVIVK